MINALRVVMVEIKEMDKRNKGWSQPSKNLKQKTVPAAVKIFLLPGAQLRQHSLEQPLSGFQAHLQQRLVPERLVDPNQRLEEFSIPLPPYKLP